MSGSRANLAAISAVAHVKAEFGEGAENGLLYVAIVLDTKTKEISAESHGSRTLLVDLVCQVAAAYMERGPGATASIGQH